jgi:hypothetical protein
MITNKIVKKRSQKGMVTEPNQSVKKNTFQEMILLIGYINSQLFMSRD